MCGLAARTPALRPAVSHAVVGCVRLPARLAAAAVGQSSGQSLLAAALSRRQAADAAGKKREKGGSVAGGREKRRVIFYHSKNFHRRVTGTGYVKIFIKILELQNITK